MLDRMCQIKHCLWKFTLWLLKILFALYQSSWKSRNIQLFIHLHKFDNIMSTLFFFTQTEQFILSNLHFFTIKSNQIESCIHRFVSPYPVDSLFAWKSRFIRIWWEFHPRYSVQLRQFAYQTKSRLFLTCGNVCAYSIDINFTFVCLHLNQPIFMEIIRGKIVNFRWGTNLFQISLHFFDS